jgi:hypothetical protein
MRARRRLHSESFRWSARVFAVLLVADAGRVLHRQLFYAGTARSDLQAFLQATAFVLVAYLLWFRTRTVLVAERGIVFRSGGSVRLIPWNDVVELREVSWMMVHPPWYPKAYELRLRSGEAIDFIGRRDAREIVNASRPRPD